MALFLSACGSAPKHAVGVTDGALAPCPSSPNCVCSQGDPGDEEHFMPPLPLHGAASDAIERVAGIITAMPRTEIISQQDRYLHATFTSAIFRWVDDVELVVDEDAGVLHFRSASRVGHSDLGVNRKRMEAIRDAWLAAG